jgi:hypothetical protein
MLWKNAANSPQIKDCEAGTHFVGMGKSRQESAGRGFDSVSSVGGVCFL